MNSAINKEQNPRAPLASAAREAMEALNVEASHLHIWLRSVRGAGKRNWRPAARLRRAGWPLRN
jgi:hypothetical protein